MTPFGREVGPPRRGPHLALLEAGATQGQGYQSFRRGCLQEADKQYVACINSHVDPVVKTHFEVGLLRSYYMYSVQSGCHVGS